MSIEIRLLKKGEEELANEVYNNVRGNSRPIEKFFWEFVNTPAGPAIYVVAVDTLKEGNQIIGTQCAIPIFGTDNNGNTFLTGKSEDTYVDPAYRGQKLFDRMYELLFEECRKTGIKIIWGFTYARKPFLKVGFEIPSDTIQGLLVNDISKSTTYLPALNPDNRTKHKIQIALLNAAAKGNRILYSFNSSKLPARFSCEEKLIEEKSEFVQSCISIQDQQTYDIFQSSAYSDWRLKKNPFNNNYCELNYYKDDKWIASILYNFRAEGFAYIEQMYFDPILSVKQKLIIIRNAVIKILEKNTFLIRFWGFDKNPINVMEMNLLKKTGFIFIKKGTGIVWKNLQPLEETKIEFKQVHFSRVYTQGNI